MLDGMNRCLAALLATALVTCAATACTRAPGNDVRPTQPAAAPNGNEPGSPRVSQPGSPLRDNAAPGQDVPIRETPAAADNATHVPNQRLAQVDADSAAERAGAAARGARAAAADANAGEIALADATVKAHAELEPTQGNDARGSVEFYATPAGMAINVRMTGLKPGTHGFHIHETGDCGAPDASSAGGHFNPGGHPHGAPTDAPDQRHAGDLGNVRAEDDGTVKQWLRSDDLTLEGPTGILDKAVVVHARTDDLKSQPAGDSGARVACGVIRPTGG